MESRAQRAEGVAKDNEATHHRVFTLKLRENEEGRPLRFVTFGCQGSGKASQHDVASLLNRLCGNPEHRPDFVLMLGDNIYEWGAKAADDPAFKKYFDDIYLTLPNLQEMPFFLIPGNHDENRQNKAKAQLVNESGIPRIMHQVAHSLMKDTRFTQDEKEWIFREATFDLSHQPSWNMPRRYYSLIANDTQIFCLDSNTYVQEYLDLCDDRANITAATNQAAWLEEEIANARAANRKVIIAEHHPLYTAGKRAYERMAHNDLGIYLNKGDIERFNQLFNRTDVTDITPYNACLNDCFQHQKLTFNLLLAAHDHNISYYNNTNSQQGEYPLCQIISGGGGGDLQNRSRFSEQHEMGCFIKQNGIVVVSSTPLEEKLNLSIHTTSTAHSDYHHLEFTTHSKDAIIKFDDNINEQEDIQKFLSVVEMSLDKYFGFIGDKQNATKGRFFSGNISHGADGAERAHQLWVYIKHHHPKSFREIVADVYSRTKWNSFGSPTTHSLITLLDREMYLKYGDNMQDFVEKLAQTYKK
tara:strand:+ start:228 stop:1808 length:1581 start_codon:yes stop_codon:yes gene_type:complete